MNSAAITPDTTVARNEDVLFSEVADGMSLMDIDSGQYYHYDTTGSAVWKEMENPISVANLCRQLGEKFDVDPQTCKNDTLGFLAELQSHNLIEVS